MAVFKCKMCGASLEVNVGDKIVECEYCGSTQTVPNLDSEKKLKLYDRANHFRQHNDYDKAMAIYEQILSEDREDSEAYWSLVLCRYGIEYVTDPATGDKVPTCHRTIPESIFNDLDYKEAIAHADVVARNVYKIEAKQIDLIQKSILAISQKEKPYDIFICYKESDENNQRTKDSVIAQDIYDKITDKGYKVFFARITLEDKLGQEYEPYIYAALTSAKIMLVVGTKPEYFNAVWVKNEWARYLAFMAKDKGKYLIPCYRDINPYDMPEEFSSLQAQDLNKLGFEQDLLRGIDKILGKDKKVEVVQQNINVDTAMINSLIKRTENFLKMENFEKAQDYAEQILDFDANNAQAYKYLLLIEMEESSLESLSKTTKDFSNADNYLKIKALDDLKLLDEVNEVLKAVKTNILNQKNASILNSAVNIIRTASDVFEIKRSLDSIKSLGDWQNANEIYEEQLEFIYNSAINKLNRAQTVQESKGAIPYFSLLGDYKESKNYIVKANIKAEEINNAQIYNSALNLKESKKYVDAIKQFESIKEYKDSKEQIEICNQLKIKEEKRLAEIKRKEKRNLIISVTAVILVIILIAAAVPISNNIAKKQESQQLELELEKQSREKEVLENYISKLIPSQELVNNYNQQLSDDNYVYMGIYPQSKISNYVDVKYDSTKNNYVGSDGYRYAKIDDSYYKYEPIKWRKIVTENGVMLLSDLILDSKRFDNSSNDYKDSEIRNFLNSEFYKAAFNSAEKRRIATTPVDNSVYSTGYDTNSDACDNTQDKIFLLSYREATNIDYSFSSDSDRYAQGSDYAKARGLYVGYNETSGWWLRSPRDSSDDCARCVLSDGRIYNFGVNDDSRGVRPALNINL